LLNETIVPESSETSVLALDPRGEASVVALGTTLLWWHPTEQATPRKTSSEQAVTKLLFVGDSRFIGLSAGALTLWSTNEASIREQQTLAVSDATHIAFASKTALVVTGDASGHVTVYGLNTSGLTRLYDLHALPTAITSLATSPDGERFTAGGHKGVVREYALSRVALIQQACEQLRRTSPMSEERIAEVCPVSNKRIDP
jgi:WD40 repeat protein